jgi:outer membrane protein assembly factor BamB
VWSASIGSLSRPGPAFGALLSAGPVITNQALYVGDHDARIYRIDRSNGQVVWATDVKAHPDAVVQGDLATYDGIVVCGMSGYENSSRLPRWTPRSVSRGRLLVSSTGLYPGTPSGLTALGI